MNTPHDCSGEAAAYVLGALEPAEAEAFRRHLKECAICRDEVEALEGVVQALPMSAPQHPLPRRLRRRVIRAVRAEQAPGQPRRSAGMSWAGSRPALAALAMAAVIALVIGVSVSGSGSKGRLIHAQVTGITGSAQLQVSGGHGELIVHHLSPPPSGHVYEVWLKTAKANPVPANVLFGVNASGSAEVRLPPSLRGISQVMVTPEPNGGSAAPTHTPVITAQLS